VTPLTTTQLPITSCSSGRSRSFIPVITRFRKT
jgi:hypothetical protein